MKRAHGKKAAGKKMTVKIFIRRKPHGSLNGIYETVDGTLEALGEFNPHVEVYIEA